MGPRPLAAERPQTTVVEEHVASFSSEFTSSCTNGTPPKLTNPLRDRRPPERLDL